MKLLRIVSLFIFFIQLTVYSQSQIRIGFLADKELSQLTAEEKSAFEWLKSSFPISSVVTFESIQKGKNLSEFDLLWWHYDANIQLPESSLGSKVINDISGFVKNGKGLFLSLLAAQYVVNLKIEPTPPNKILKGPWEVKDTYKEIKGSHSFSGHPVYAGLFDGVYTWNTKQNYPFAAAYYDGILPVNGKIIGIGWDYITFNENERHVIEYKVSKGKCITAGSYLYFADNKNVYRKHLETFVKNSIGYIAGIKNLEKLTYWSFEPLDFEIKKGPLTAYTPSAKINSINLSVNSGLEITQDADSKNYCSTSGLRTLMMGKETGGLDEIWVHPLRAIRNYSVTILSGYGNTELNKSVPKFTVRPESFVRNYKINSDNLIETAFASRELPSGVINYNVTSAAKCKIKIAFDVDNRVMWPYEENYPGKYTVSGNNPVIVASRDGSICSYFGTDIKALTEVSVLESKEKTKYTHIEFTVELNKGNNNFNFVFASSNESSEKTKKYFEKTIGGIQNSYLENVNYYKNLFAGKTVIETGDIEFNNAYKWALAGVDKFFVYTYPLGSSLMAGFGTTERGWDGAQKVNGRPGYAWYFGRDSEWTSFALLDYGDFAKVKSVLEFLGKYQDLTGKIFHELTSSGAVHYDAADATPLYIILMGKYLDATGDVRFIKKEWPKIKKAIDFCYSTDTDKDGLIENTNVGHGWVEGGKIYGAHVTFYLAGLWSSTLEYGSKIAAVMNYKDLSANYTADAKKVKGLIEKDFWNKETKFYNDGKNIDGAFSDTKTVQVAVPMYFNATDKTRSAESIKEFFGNDYATNWGARIIGESNPMFNPRGYHYGTVWPLFTGWVSLAEYKYGYSLQAFQEVMSNLMIYKNWGLGYIEEVLNGIEYKPGGVCSHQAWSESMAIQPLLEGMIGIRPEKINNKLTLSTQIPPNFDKLNVRKIRFGNNEIDLSYSTDYSRYEYKFSAAKQSGERIVLRRRMNPGETIVRTEENGKPVKYKVEDGFVEIEFLLDKVNNIVITSSGGIALMPVVNNPKVGDKPYGTRILEEKLDGNIYKLKLEGVPEKSEKLTFFTDRIIKRISGANIISESGKSKIIEAKIPKTDKNYGFLNIELELN